MVYVNKKTNNFLPHMGIGGSSPSERHSVTELMDEGVFESRDQAKNLQDRLAGSGFELSDVLPLIAALSSPEGPALDKIDSGLLAKLFNALTGNKYQINPDS